MKQEIKTPEDIGKNTTDHEAIAKYYFEKGVEYASQQIQNIIRQEVLLSEYRMLKDFFEQIMFNPLQSADDKLKAFIEFKEHRNLK